MTHSTKTISALLFTFILFFQSCKKNDQTTPDVATSLQNKNWKLVALTVSPAINGITDAYTNYLEDCERDNLFTFNLNNVFVLNEEATKCDPADPQTQNGTWNYNSTSKMLFFQLTLPSDEYNMMITQIDATSFTGVEKETVSGINYTYTWRFAKQ